MRKIFIFLALWLLTGSLVIAQTVQLSGTVTGADDGQPIAGVSVTVKGTTLGAITGVDGKYSIQATADAKTLSFSFIGYKSQEVAIDGKTKIDIILEQDLVMINEVVVVGYGTQIKSKVTGSISKVDGDILKNVPVVTVEQALQGKTAGVFIESVNGKSTGTTNMRIRGSSSITAYQPAPFCC